MSDEISIRELMMKFGSWYRFILSKWVIVLLFAIFGAGLGYYYASKKKIEYIATTTFVLEEGGGSGLGQYSGLSALMGVDLNGGGGIFQGDNLFELYKSRNMIQKTLLSKITVNGQSELLIDRYIRFKGLRTKWIETNAPWKNIQFGNHSVSNHRLTDSIINVISKSIKNDNLEVTKLDKKLSIIKVEVTAEDEIFAKEFNEQIVRNVNDFYVQTKTSKSLENLAILQYQTDSIRQALNKAISTVASSIDVNPNVNLSRQVLRVPSQKKQIDVESNKAMLGELIKNEELTKISLRRDKPLIQVVDDPLYPLETKRIGKKMGTLLGGIISTLLVVGYLSFIALYRYIMRD